MFEQRRGVGAVDTEPFHLSFRSRAEVVEHLVAEIRKGLEVARVRDGEALDAYAIFHRRPRRMGVFPCDVVARTGGEDRDVVARGEALRKLAAMHLRTARDVCAVALDDEREFHVPSTGSERPGPVEGRRWTDCPDTSPSSRRSRVSSIASSWTQANSTWLMRRCRSKLSRLNS